MGFLKMFLGILGATLLGNVLIQTTGTDVIRASEGTIRAGLYF